VTRVYQSVLDTIAAAHPIGQLVIVLQGERARDFARELACLGLSYQSQYGWCETRVDGAAVIWRAS
jgi:hypothetical protein